MRISDWSSDVCSSDLDGDRVRVRGTVEYGGSGGWGDRNDRDDWRDRVRFTCTYSDGSVDGVWLEDGYAWQIGRASCRARECQSVKISVVDGYLIRNLIRRTDITYTFLSHIVYI